MTILDCSQIGSTSLSAASIVFVFEQRDGIVGVVTGRVLEGAFLIRR